MKSTFAILLIVAEMVSAKVSAAQTEQLRKKNFNLSDGIALQGYDVISYFTSSSPKKGSKELNYTYKGITYYFASASSLSIFKSTPDKWEPAYGGWCAYAMGNSGEKVEVDPSTFKILNNKLYLFYNAYFTNTLPKWNKDEAKLKSKADNNWSTLQSQ